MNDLVVFQIIVLANYPWIGTTTLLHQYNWTFLLAITILLKTLCCSRFAFFPFNCRDHFQSHRVPVIKSSLNVPLKHFQKEPPEMFCKKKLFLKIHKFHRRNLFWSLFLESCRPATLLKRDLNTVAFLQNLRNF